MRNIGGFLIILILAGCIGNAQMHEDATVLLESIAEQNRSYKEHSFQKVPIYDFSLSTEEELPSEILETLRITNMSQVSPSFTKDHMIKDIEIFHLALKHMYALYEYMGGDRVFLAARDGLIAHPQN